MQKAVFHKDMDIDVYHSHKDVISKSMLSDFADCPARFKYKYIDGNETPKTKSLRLGNAVHVLALEPELWKKGYHILPAHYFDSDGKKKPFRHDGRMQVVQDQYESAGYDIERNKLGEIEFKPREHAKVILTQKEYATVEQMANALAKNIFACKLLKSAGYVEGSIFFDHEVENPITGEIEIVKMRTRPDYARNDAVMCDLKIAAAVKPALFHKSASDYHYELSPAITDLGWQALHGKPIEEYVFITVEQVEPNLVECFGSMQPMDDVLGITYMEYGKAYLKHLLQQYVACRHTGVWPSYQTKIGGMKLPHWKLQKFITEGF